MPVRTINDHIHVLEEPLVGRTPVRATLVSGSDFAVLIDTGINRMAPALLDLVRRVSGSPSHVRLIVNTHGHHDHIGSNAQLSAACEALLAAHADSIPWIEEFDTHCREFCLVAPDILPDSAEMREECFSILDSESRVGLALTEGSRLRIGGSADLEAIFLPGHMRAELGFIEHCSNSLIIGDAVVCSGVVDIGPIFHGYQNVAAYRRTLARLRALNREHRFSTVVSGHLPIVDHEGFDDLLNRAERFLARIEEDLVGVVERAGSVSLPSAWRELCRMHGVREEFRGFAMVRSHLEHLVDLDVLASVGEGLFRGGRHHGAAAAGPPDHHRP